MSAYVALLRAVNVGGRSVPMAGLREAVAALGFTGVRTLLQSGNVVFQTRARATAQLETALEEMMAKRLGVATDVLVRGAGEWAEVVARNPFPDEARSDPGRLVVVALKAPPAREAVEALRAAIVGREIVRADGRHAYIVYPDGQGRSKLTPALIERKLGTRGTARNWNTVLKLAAAVAE